MKKKAKYFSYDYYRMTGELYRIGFKSFLQRCMRHNLRFVFLYRKYQQKATICTKFKLYRMSRKYGLEISVNAQIGKGLYLGHPYNITIGEGVVLGDNVNLHKGCTIGRTNRGNRDRKSVV